jgi:hypothetical protein
MGPQHRRRGALLMRPRCSIIAVVIADIITLGVSCNGFREDEIECEKALGRLVECCPGLRPPRDDCSYRESHGCDDSLLSSEYPVLRLADSQCIQDSTCADLVASGTCARAEGATKVVVAYAGKQSDRPSTPPAPRICTR